MTPEMSALAEIKFNQYIVITLLAAIPVTLFAAIYIVNSVLQRASRLLNIVERHGVYSDKNAQEFCTSLIGVNEKLDTVTAAAHTAAKVAEKTAEVTKNGVALTQLKIDHAMSKLADSDHGGTLATVGNGKPIEVNAHIIMPGGK